MANSRTVDRFYCNSGETEKTLYVLDGEKLIEAGKEDTVGLINSYEDSCDIKKLIERVTLGEYELLAQRTGAYIDTTKFPTTVCEAANMARESKAMYDSLPEDLKKEIGTYNQFANWTDSDFAKFVDNHRVVPVPVDPVESEEK